MRATSRPEKAASMRGAGRGDVGAAGEQIGRQGRRQRQGGGVKPRPFDVVGVGAASDQRRDLVHDDVAVGLRAHEILPRHRQQSLGLALGRRIVEAAAHARRGQTENAFALPHRVARHVDQEIGPPQPDIGLGHEAREHEARRLGIERRGPGGGTGTLDLRRLLAEEIERPTQAGLGQADPLRRAADGRRRDEVLAEAFAQEQPVAGHLRIGGGAGRPTIAPRPGGCAPARQRAWDCRPAPCRSGRRAGDRHRPSTRCPR
ncbi:MAG: hypothetical protein WDM81_06085 [Rhizomicrobium sp.]